MIIPLPAFQILIYNHQKRPIEGAAKEGVGGLITGFGRGLVGYVKKAINIFSHVIVLTFPKTMFRIVTKPVVGMFDLANNVSQGVRNTTTIFDVNDIDRLRLPRYIAGDGILRVSIFQNSM